MKIQKVFQKIFYKIFRFFGYFILTCIIINNIMINNEGTIQNDNINAMIRKSM